MDLLYTIGADCTNFLKNIGLTGPEAEKQSKQIIESLAAAGKQVDTLGGSTISASMKFQQMRSGLSALRDGTLAFAVGGQRADMMLMAMGHHITSLVNETGSLSGAMKALGSSIMGPGGVILGLTIAYELFQHFSKGEKEAYDATKHFTEAQDAQKQVVNNLEDSYGKAVSNVQELTTNIKLAKEGFINKNEVVKEYNETLGKTMGAVKSLDEVEQKLISGAPDYIKMMLYKAAAQTALKEASDKAIEAAKVQLKPQEQFKPNSFTQFSMGQSSAPGFVPGNSILSEADKQKQIAAIAEENRAKEKAKFEKDQSDLLKIFTDFQDKAAKIAADHKWTFIDPEKAKKSKEALDGLSKLQKELRDAETALENSIIAGKTQADDFDSPLVRRVNAANGAIERFKANMATVMAGLGAGNTTNADSIKNVKVESTTIGNGDADLNAMNAQIAAFKKLADLKISSRALTKEYNKELKDEAAAGKEIVKVFGQGLMGAFENALSGTSSFVSAMGSFLAQLIEKMIAAALAAAALAALLSFTGVGALLGLSSSASSFSGIFGALSGLSSLGGAASANLPTHASGGIFTTAHAGIFGEAGPEAIVTPKHLQEFAGVSGGNGNMHVSFDPIMTGPVLNYKARLRSDKYINRIK